ncbi:hypothetical protein, partial [Aureivirga marina]|uniref:hypothetical protein n=1 Tax=Aureivirga marina TaxID=1182451 RepID=UPI0018C91955
GLSNKVSIEYEPLSLNLKVVETDDYAPIELRIQMTNSTGKTDNIWVLIHLKSPFASRRYGIKYFEKVCGGSNSGRYREDIWMFFDTNGIPDDELANYKVSFGPVNGAGNFGYGVTDEPYVIFTLEDYNNVNELPLRELSEYPASGVYNYNVHNPHPFLQTYPPFNQAVNQYQCVIYEDDFNYDKNYRIVDKGCGDGGSDLINNVNVGFKMTYKDGTENLLSDSYLHFNMNENTFYTNINRENTCSSNE